MPKIKTKIAFTFLGTGQHRTTHQSVLVSSFNQIQALAQDPNSSIAARLFDGPGCRGTIEDPMPGSYLYKKGQKIPDMALAAKEERNFRDALTEAYHAITGEGIESSILEAVTYLNEVIEENGGEIPKQMNLQGFSRGADNCVRLANVIYLLYPQIKVNLFLVDPVPGPGRRDDPESYHIPPNVKDCHVTLMLNEHRKLYAPQHSERYIFTNPETTVAYHYMPGRHGAGLSTRENAIITPRVSQTLVQDSLLKFNIEHGVLPKNAANLNWHRSAGSHNQPVPLTHPQKSLTKKERFEQLCAAMIAFKILTVERPMKMTVYSKRRVFTDRERYVLDADVFIDSEHRALFKTLYPATFNWFFEKNYTSPERKAYSQQEVFHELQQLTNSSNIIFYHSLLDKFNITEIRTEEDIIRPQGIARDERVRQGESLVDDELSYLQYCLNTIVNEYHYRVPTTWFGNWLPGHEERATKSWSSDKIEQQIRAALHSSTQLPPMEAKKLLRSLILSIQAQPNEDFFFHEIKKITPNSKRYNRSVYSLLQRYEKLLPPEYAELVTKALTLIKRQMNHRQKDDYQKRQEIQTYLLSLNTAIHRMNIQLEDKNILCEQLFANINELSMPSYAEPKILEDAILELEAYRLRGTFWSYFPFSQSLGLYNPENQLLVEQVLETLRQIKHSNAPASDLNQMEAVLKHASTLYALKHQQEKNESSFGFWKKHVTFKLDPLNKLLEKHLKKVTQISNLIFFIPPEVDQQLHLSAIK